MHLLIHALGEKPSEQGLYTNRGGGVGESDCDFHKMIGEDLSEDTLEQRQEGGEGGSQVPFWERVFQAEVREEQKS